MLQQAVEPQVYWPTSNRQRLRSDRSRVNSRSRHSQADQLVPTGGNFIMDATILEDTILEYVYLLATS